MKTANTMFYGTVANTDAGTRSRSISGIIRSRNIVVRIGRLSSMVKFILAIVIFIIAFGIGCALGKR